MLFGGSDRRCKFEYTDVMHSITLPQLYVFYNHHTGPDPGLLERGFKFTKGIRFGNFNCLLIFTENSS